MLPNEEKYYYEMIIKTLKEIRKELEKLTQKKGAIITKQDIENLVKEEQNMNVIIKKD